MRYFSFKTKGVTKGDEDRQSLVEEYPQDKRLRERFDFDKLDLRELDDPKLWAPVLLTMEPDNKVDPFAIAVLNERGEKMGYVGRDYPEKLLLWSALCCHRDGICVVEARAQKTGGFGKGPRKASYGLEVVAKSSLLKDGDDEITQSQPRPVNSGAQKRKETMVVEWKKHDRSKKTLSKLRDYARFDDSLDCLGTTKKIRRAIEKEDEVFFKGNRYAKMRSKYLGTSKFRWYESLAQHAWEIENDRRISKSGVKGGDDEC